MGAAARELSRAELDRGAGAVSGRGAPAPVYALRCDLSEALGATEAEVGPIHRELASALSEALGGSARVVSVRYESGDLPEAPAISLDPWIAAAASLRVSREFGDHAAGDPQARGLRLCASPEAPPLSDQLAAIPAGDYRLVDDDVASGQTVGWVRGLLRGARPDVRVVGAPHTLLQAALRRAGESGPLYDVVDARDFIRGARCGGLVISGRRELYTSRRVSLLSRARLPESSHARFRERVRELGLPG